MNGYFEGTSQNKYLKLIPTIESKYKIKKYEELLSKISTSDRMVASAIYDNLKSGN